MAGRVCLNCGGELVGRVDKKFCDDQCRTTYNNQFKVTPDVVKEINNILKKNRQILEQLTPTAEGKIKLHEKRLLDKGFNFSYFTHNYITKTGTAYFFCYEYGYLKLENQFYMLVKRQSD